MKGLENFDQSSENLRNLDSLIGKIKGKTCCAFIGAGLSADAKYPTWGDLIEKLKGTVNAKNGHEFVLSSVSYPDQIEELRNELTDDEYRQTIIESCGPNGKLDYWSIHQTILDIPFSAYITTNYDCCIENAALRMPIQRTPHTYPELDETLLRDGDIFHIHGILERENPEAKFNTLVLSRRDYDRAYLLNTGSGLPRFLSILYERLTVMFLGFSLKDEELINAIKVAQANLQTRIDYERQVGFGERVKPKHFIILRKNDPSVSEDSIKDLDLLPVYYTGTDYSTLQGALEGIREKTTDVSYEPVRVNWEMFEAHPNG